MTLLPPDRQRTWHPVWLVDLTGAASKSWIQLDWIQNNMLQLGVPTAVPRRFATEDLDVAGSFYHGRIIDEPVVEQGFFDSYFGVSRVTTVNFRLANSDALLDDYHTLDIRGTTLTITRYDAATATSVTEFTGKIATTALGEGYLEIEAVAPDLSVFEQPFPLGTVTAELFTDSAVDMGVTIPVIYGNVVAHRCPYINDDTTLDQYDYLVGRGSLTVSALYRDGPNNTLYTVNASEYTVETTRYSGMTTIRFPVRQVNFSNAFHAIFADVTGFSAERNFARAIRTLLSDTTYGLSQSVNAASFNAAEALIDPVTGTAVTGLYLDGAFATARAASDVLRDLLLVRGMRMGMNASGEWTVTVDTEQTDIRMALSDGTADGERNILGISPRRRPSVQDSVRTYRLRYRQSEGLGDASRLEVTRPVNAGLGHDVVVEHPYIRNTTTADTVIAYLSQREIYRTETVDVDITQEARQIIPGERVTLTYAPLGFSAQAMEVVRVRKGLDRIVLTLGQWSASTYTYTAATILPTDPATPDPDDGTGTTASPTTIPGTIGVTFDAGGAEIAVSSKGDVYAPYAAVIQEAVILADQAGDIVVDIWKAAYASFPPTVAGTICAAAKPTLSDTDSYRDTTLTGWTTALAAGDVLRFNVDSSNTLTRAVVALKVKKTGA